MAKYLRNKGFDIPKPFKRNREKFIVSEELTKILNAILEDNTKNKRRDHALIYMAYHLGLRSGEAVILNRESFRDLHLGIIHIRTLKSTERIPFTCPGCHRKSRIAIVRSGLNHTCGKCNMTSRIPIAQQIDATTFKLPSGRIISTLPPEKEPPAIEKFVLDYCQSYIDSMREDQIWLFEGGKRSNSGHLCEDTARVIFNTYAKKAGLHSIYSFHSLRHGRGVAVYERFEDLIGTRDMLRQSSTKTTEIYAHMSPKKAKELQEKMESDAGGLAHNPFAENK